MLVAEALRHSWRSIAIGLAAVTLVALPSAALAAGTYPTGSTGYDVSYPQCGAAAPAGSFAIVGVTGGRAYSTNSCFAAEYDAAPLSGGVRQVSIYMNLNAAIGSTASNGLTGPAGTCKRNDKTCVAYNYGYNAAGNALTTAGSRTAGTWWLDIETGNSWNSQASLNQQTIQGAVDGLRAGGVANVGIYSTPSMWRSITGGWQNGLPVWFGGTSTTTCATASGFTGGPLWVLQTASGASDGDLGC